MRISLIGTYHAETGLTSVSELHGILERLQPEVIFAEIPSSKLSRYINGSHANLESQAVAIFRKNHAAEVVPVDLDEPSEDFFRQAGEMFVKVEHTSAPYRQLIDQQSSAVRDGGFAYLNSERCQQVLADIHKETLDTLAWTRNEGLKEIYEHWIQVNDLREKTMLANIYRYCEGCPLTSGALLVGTAHRKALMGKIQQLQCKDSSQVTWDFEIPLTMRQK